MATPSIAIIPSAYKAGVVAAVLPNNGDADLDFTRGTTARRINSQGLIQEESVNVPRLDYSDGVCPSLLLEPQSTNSLLHSNQFDTTWQNPSNGVVLNSSQNGIYNSTDAWKLIQNTNTGFHSIVQSVNLTGDYVYSIYAKEGEYEGISFFIPNPVTGANSATTFNLKSGMYTSNTHEGVSFNIGNGWYRLSLKTKLSGTHNINTYVNQTTQKSETGDGTSGIYIQYAQLEQLPYATSYIPTQGSPITREADFASKTGLSSYINSSEGVLYANISASEYSEQIQRISISDSSENNKIHLQFIKNTNGVNVLIRSAGALVFEKPYVLNDITAFNKIAFKWKVNDFALWVNGVNAWSINAGNTPVVLNRIGFDSGNNAFPFYGKCKDLRVYNTALTDAELQTLTTL